ncbi:hypothetical protein KIL84_004041 [Mauremys mutica]|uniref:Uncharacterized protein n=1 Tax=Mauremys mutica TaxID=74926 RepID=A0A9D4B705_9SAUR|nr:hypothetical protein KIL84_004041 [Mauremys mutica]
MAAVSSGVLKERTTGNSIKNTKAFVGAFEKYFRFPEGGSEKMQLAVERGTGKRGILEDTHQLRGKQMGGQCLGDKRKAARKLWARIIVHILKKAKEVMRRKKQKEMTPSGDSQAVVSEMGEAESGPRLLQGGGDSHTESDFEDSPEGSLDGSPSTPDELRGGPLEANSPIAWDVEDTPDGSIEKSP